MPHSTTLIETHTGKVLLNEAAYNLIRDNAPQELPLYVEARDRYLANPEQYGHIRKGEDEVLGIGEVAVVKTLTKIIFPVIAPILQYLVKVMAETFQEELGEEASEWVRSLFSSEKKPQPILEQVDLDMITNKIEEIAIAESLNLGIIRKSEAGTVDKNDENYHKVRLISNAISLRLALAKK